MSGLSQRQWYLRNERERHTSLVDPRPVEAAVLEPRADSMRDMVNNHMRQQLWQREMETAPDEDFLEDDDLELERELMEAPWSEEQLVELASDLGPLEPEPPGETASEPVLDGSETGGGEADAKASGSEATAP